jgi:nucleoside 2-deoxyribosyltransferase
VAPADLAAVDASGAVLALLDGLDPGTLFEVGYARARGIPIIAVAESVGAEALTMLIGSDCYMTNDLTTGIYAACWQVMGDVI